MSTSTTHTAARQRARRELSNFASFNRRPTTGWVRNRSAAWSYEKSLKAVVAVEDAEGVEATAGLSDRLRTLYFEARAAKLLSINEIYAVERRVFA